MNQTWIESMRYHGIPENEWQPFYDWYCHTYPDGCTTISAAYDTWKMISKENT